MNWNKVAEIYDKYKIHPAHYKYIKAYKDQPDGISNTKLGELTNTSKMTGTERQNLFISLGIVEDISTHPLRRRGVLKTPEILKQIEEAETNEN